MKTITAQQLIDAGVKCGELDKFRELFGETLTLKNERHAITLAKRHVGKFSWGLAAKILFSESARFEFKKAENATWDKYRKVSSAALDEYSKTCATTFAELYWSMK